MTLLVQNFQKICGLPCYHYYKAVIQCVSSKARSLLFLGFRNGVTESTALLGHETPSLDNRFQLLRDEMFGGLKVKEEFICLGNPRLWSSNVSRTSQVP